MPFLTLAHSGVLPCVLAALPTLLHAPPCPCTLLEPPGQVCATPIRSGVGCGTALAAPITLPGGTWGMPGAPEGDGGPMGCHSSRGQQGFGYMGLPLAPTTEGSVQLWVAGGGSWTCCWLWGAPAHILAPLRGPCSYRQLLRGIFRYQPCPICVSNVPGGGWLPPAGSCHPLSATSAGEAPVPCRGWGG